MVRIRGHRGAAALAPENTLPSFERALDADVYAVEFDVRQAADELVVLHDATLDRTTTGTGPVREHTYQEIRQLDAGGAYVPTLRETLAYFDRHRARVDELRIEIKEAETTQGVYEAVQEYAVQDRTVFHSFQQDALTALNRIDPDAQTSYVVESLYDGVIDDVQALDCDILTVHYDNVTEEDLRQVEQYGIKTDLWGVADESELRTAISRQPDYVGTDNPVQAQHVVTALETADQAEEYA